MAAKAALALALRRNGMTCNALASSLGIREKAARRILNPRHDTAVGQIKDALVVLGELEL